MGIKTFTEPIRIFSNQKPINPMEAAAKEFIKEKNPEEAFFVCNLGELIRKHREWEAALPRVKPFYAVKCNDDEVILRILAGLGTRFDCASKGEMAKVIGLGVKPENIIFANPAKQASHIRAAVDFNVTTMTFDNENELYKIKQLHPNARLVIRIRCDAEKAQCQLGMKFGVLVEEAPALISRAYELGLSVVGVSFHVGSGCMEPAVFNRAIASAYWLFGVAQDIGYNFNLLDIGGGFPGNTGTSITDIGDVVNASINQFFPEGCGVEIIAEPGRFYVAAAFTLLTQIHSVREVKSELGERSFMYYINDGVYGSFNCVLYDHAVVSPQTLKEPTGELIPCSIWGPTCDGLDQVCSSVLLPEMKMGEWLLFSDMGAYTMVAAGTFNGFPVSKIEYIATDNSWDELKKYLGFINMPMENVPLFKKAGVGCNRDAVGWGTSSVPHPLTNGSVIFEEQVVPEPEASGETSYNDCQAYLDLEYAKTEIPIQVQ